MPIRILVADNSPFMLSAVRRLLQEEPRIRAVGETSAFSTIMQTIVNFNPEVLLFDLHMVEKRNLAPPFIKIATWFGEPCARNVVRQRRGSQSPG
jgi:response regulator of citrate/malate metabolism